MDAILGETNGRGDLLAEQPEESMARGRQLCSIDDALVVEEEPTRARLGHRDRVVGGGVDLQMSDGRETEARDRYTFFLARNHEHSSVRTLDGCDVATFVDDGDRESLFAVRRRDHVAGDGGGRSIDRASVFVVHFDAGESRSQRFDDREMGMRHDLGRAAAHDAGPRGVRPDDRQTAQRSRIEW